MADPRAVARIVEARIRSLIGPREGDPAPAPACVDIGCVANTTAPGCVYCGAPTDEREGRQSPSDPFWPRTAMTAHTSPEPHLRPLPLPRRERTDVTAGQSIEIITPDGERDKVAYWRDRIVACHGRAVEAIIATGEELIAAREDITDDGEWTQLCYRLPFSDRWARLLVSIAQSPILSDRKYASDLPASATTLSELSKLPASDLRAAIEDGRVTPELERSQVGRLRQAIEPVPTPPPPTPGRYRAAVIDPPWPIAKIERDVRAQQGDVLDYPTMSIDDIAALPVADSLDPAGAHVYLWTTHKHIPDAFDLFDAWGVRYQCLMTWNKNVGITPFSWMYDTEHVLFGSYGDGLKLARLGLRLSFSAPTAGHSVKPDVFYERVRAASPPPRVDWFNRRDIDGFEPWGREAARGLR